MMSRTISAATIHKMALEHRIPMYFRLRKAADDARMSETARAQFRLAARFILGNVDSAEYDIMARLQILEGATGNVTLGKNAGTWWKKGRRGLADAKDHYAGTDIDPSWLSTGKTGMISKIYGMVQSKYRQWSRGGELHFTADDILQNAIMGLGIDANFTPMAGGSVFLSTGAKNRGVARSIPEGKVTPQGVAGIVGANLAAKVKDQLKSLDRNRSNNVTETGDSVFDAMSNNPREFYSVLADMLHDPRSPVHGMIMKRFLKELGKGKWAEIAAELFTAELSGTRVKKQDMAAKHDMAPGTLSKVIRLHAKPAMDKLKLDKAFKGEVIGLAENAMMRSAQSRITARVRRVASGKKARQVDPLAVVNSLGLIAHHGIKPRVSENGVSVRLSGKMAMSMARAYIETHLDEQFGSSARFKVQAGSSEIYIDIA